MRQALWSFLQKIDGWLHDRPVEVSPFQAVLVGCLSILIALAVRLLIAPVEAGLQYVTFFPAVTLATLLAGLRAGLLATVLGMFFATWIFTPPYWKFDAITIDHSLWSNSVFLFDGLIVSYAIDAMRRYRAKYQAELVEARILQQQLKADEVLHLRFHDLIESSDDAIISKSLTGIIESWNPSAERIFGYTAAEMIGQPMLRLIPADLQDEEPALLARIASGQRVKHFETQRQHKNGALLEVSVTISPIFDTENRVCGISIIARDITEAKRDEHLLRAARDEAERAGRLKSSFLATMSHEIRTPLGGLLGMLEQLSMSELDAEQMTTLLTAQNSGHALLRIVNDILDWSKIEEGKLKIAPMPTVLPPLLQEVVDTYSRVASSKSLSLWCHIDPRLVHTYLLDPLRLSQILNNFTSNAIKFTLHGEVEVRATLFESDDGCDRVHFTVKDTGIGIAEQDQPQLFQDYVQSSDSSRMYGGTGLGLSICRRLVEMMGGELTLDSRPNRGSTFGVILNLPRTELPPQKVYMAHHAVTQHQIRPLFDGSENAPLILVVDDHPTNRDLLARQVTTLGVRVKTAENGRVGLSLWQDGRFALIISDCHMPDMDGYEMSKSIRRIEALKGLSRTPIIAWTANALPEEVEQVQQADMDELLIKPVDLETLSRTLARWLMPASQAGAQTGTTGAVPSAAAAGESGKLIDLSQLSAVIADRAEQAEVLRQFMAHVDTDRRHLDGLLGQGDIAAVQSVAHRMKGSSRMVGAIAITEICAALETAARHEKRGEIAVLRAELDTAIEQLAAYVAGL